MEQQNLLRRKMALEELCDFRFTGRVHSKEIAESLRK
jgi:hypothetical protein